MTHEENRKRLGDIASRRDDLGDQLVEALRQDAQAAPRRILVDLSYVTEHELMDVLSGSSTSRRWRSPTS
jgi:hypothetical protein